MEVTVLRAFVVTNHRFTKEFREALVGATLDATPLTLECESINLEGTTEKQTFRVISESVNMVNGLFFCTGHTGTEFFRLEEEMGTLMLSIT